MDVAGVGIHKMFKPKLMLLLFGVLLLSTLVHSVWYYSGWSYRQPYFFNASNTVNGFIFEINLNTTNFGYANCTAGGGKDIRATWLNSSSGTELEAKFWMPMYNTSGNSYLQINTSSIVGGNQYNVYCGNSGATNASNISVTGIRYYLDAEYGVNDLAGQQLTVSLVAQTTDQNKRVFYFDPAVGVRSIVFAANATNSMTTGTLEMTFRSTVIDADHNLFGKASAAMRSQIGVPDRNGYYWTVNGEASMQTVTAMNFTNVYSTASFPWNSSNKYIFFNNTIQVNSSTTATSPASDSFYIGQNSVNFNEQFTGYLKRFVVYDHKIEFNKLTFNSTGTYEILNYTQISSCTNLNNTGEYRLTQNVSTTGTCIDILNNSITLHCDGFAMFGDRGAGDYGISAVDKTGINITSCNVFSFGSNIRLSNTNFTIYTVNISNASAVGINITNSHGNNINNARTYDGQYGIWLDSSQNNTVQYSELKNHSVFGIMIYNGTGNLVTGGLSYNLTNYINITGGGSNTLSPYSVGYAGNAGYIIWSSLAASSFYLIEDVNIITRPTFISVNDTIFPILNSTAELYLTTDCAKNTTVIRKGGFPTYAGDIIGNGTRIGKVSSCTAGLGTFTVSSFSGHALGNISYTYNSTFNSLTNETVNNTLAINLNGAGGNITAYSVNVTYNSTRVVSLSASGLNNATINLTVAIVSPLMLNNNTNKTWFVNVSVTQNGSSDGNNETGNQTIMTWYYLEKYKFITQYEYTVEENNTITNSIPSNPDGAASNVTYSLNHSFNNCIRNYANGSAINGTICNNTLVTTNSSHFTVQASHVQIDGLLSQDHYVLRNFTLIYNVTNESASSKSLSNVSNTTRDYFVWLVNYTNGSIIGASNLSTFYYVTFQDETNLSTIFTDSATLSFTAWFKDGGFKNYTLAYIATNAVKNATVNGYPNWYTANITSHEVYTKALYTGRSRFLRYASYTLSIQENLTVYLLLDSLSTYAIITVRQTGTAVPDAYIQILKYYGTNNSYINIEQKVTNIEGQAFAYVDIDAFYKFSVADSHGIQLYFSSSPEQFICNPTCQITINIGSSLIGNYIMPYAAGDCYGSNTSNSIIYNYVDYTAKTNTINFLAKRDDNYVCNYTISGSSGSYICTLPAGENLTQYVYTCIIRRTASPDLDWLAKIIDFTHIAGINDWMILGIVIIVGIAVASIHPAVAVGLIGVAIFLLRISNIIQVKYELAFASLIVSALLVYLMLKEKG